MGGSGGGGSFSSRDMSKIQSAREERLKAIASKSTKILFVCDQSDRKSLEALLAKSSVFTKDRAILVDSSQARSADDLLEGASFLVCFTDATKDSSFIDAMIDKAMVKKTGGVHVKANSKSMIPPKISAYRM